MSIQSAITTTDVQESLATLRSRENEIVFRLNAILDSRKDVERELSTLDGLRVVLSTRDTQNTTLAGTADTADRLSTRVRELDAEKKRVEETLRVVEQVTELKACVAGVVGSMGSPQDWEAAAHYLHRASRIPEDVLRGSFAAAVVPTIESPEPPWDTLEVARESLCALFLREFASAANDEDSAKVTRFFKLFPLIDRSEIGLDAYGRYICRGVANAARETLKKAERDSGSQDVLFYANSLTKLFEHIAQIVDSHSGLVKQHYGPSQMAKVVEKLQAEADVQGGVILDTWAGDRSLDSMITGVKSYPFMFLAQRSLTQRQGGTGLAIGTVESDADHASIDMKEIDGLLSEMTIMLERWERYSRFVARYCQDAIALDDTALNIPKFLKNSNLSRKISEKLFTPYSIMTTFFVRRSIEKAFQMDLSPTGLSLTQPISGHPPFIIQAIDDVMYVVDLVLQKVISASNYAIAASAVPDIGRVLQSDLIGIIHRRMRDEYYPASTIQGGLAPEDKVVKFIVLINSLDIAKEYLDKLIRARAGLEVMEPRQLHDSPSLKDSFPFNEDAEDFVRALNRMNTAFSSKATTLLNEGIQALLDEVIRPRLQPVLANAFRDIEYGSSGNEVGETFQEDGVGGPPPQPSERFEEGWNLLMKPLSRIMTPPVYLALLVLTAKLLARILEKRLWSLSGRVSAFGAIKMERDFTGMVDVVSKGSYSVRELFVRVQQICTLANMDDDEWAETTTEEQGDTEWALNKDERKRARQMVSS
ncbi:Golgi transport complex subunit 4 [Neonectria magnoliae]|uniref:Conserved oligomeric Golgi complex subunit 4 n=1 Tax=Neonectria magnoliae TaxID=2732573 RepID=A0ABR1I2L2_9HYPO